MHVESGTALYVQGQPSDSWSVVLSGRLRSTTEHAGSTTVLAVHPSLLWPSLDFIWLFSLSEIFGAMSLLVKSNRLPAFRGLSDCRGVLVTVIDLMIGNCLRYS